MGFGCGAAICSHRAGSLPVFRQACCVPTFSAPGLQLGLPDCADARVEGFLQFAARFGVGKDTSSQFVAAQMAVVANDFGAEQSLDFRQGGLARLDDLTGDDIGIDDRQATLTEQFGCG